MRAIKAFQTSLILASIAMAIGAGEAVAVVPSEAAMSPVIIAGKLGSLENVYWVRRCNHRGCRRWWVGESTPNDGCFPWSATHWGVRRAWVC